MKKSKKMIERILKGDKIIYDEAKDPGSEEEMVEEYIAGIRKRAEIIYSIVFESETPQDKAGTINTFMGWEQEIRKIAGNTEAKLIKGIDSIHGDMSYYNEIGQHEKAGGLRLALTRLGSPLGI